MKSPANYGRPLGYLIVLIGLGIIGLGYNGAAGESLGTTAQTPYLLSGGFLGLAVVVFGVGLIINASAREDRARLEAVLLQLVDAQAPDSGTARVPSSASGLFAAGAASYHRPDCRLVDGREEMGYVTAAEASAKALAPCRVCKPETATV
ncbi:MAG: hypothetical protein JWO22_1282 [Frankiales bacterium]|nr:hypothetical protein [Frankiales bacterium]